MAEVIDWYEEKFSQLYNEEFVFLERRMKKDPSCTIEELESVLENLYIADGNNIGGRSPVAQISLSASIAAYEAFIAEKKKERL